MKKFASGISFYKLLWLFVIGSVVGAWYEQILIFILYGALERRSSLVIGPFSTLYGFAYVISILLLYKVKKWNHLIFFGALLGGSIEFIASFIQELVTNTSSWDYSHLFLNIAGRTTIPFSLFWGILIYLMVGKIYPWLSTKIEAVPQRFGVIISNIMLLFLLINFFVSGSMLIRRYQRSLSIDPITPLGEFYDNYFTDQRIIELYPNLKFLDSTD